MKYDATLSKKSAYREKGSKYQLLNTEKIGLLDCTISFNFSVTLKIFKKKLLVKSKKKLAVTYSMRTLVK